MSPIDWDDPDWGGRVHIAGNGSHVPDRHDTTSNGEH
jgi:hypothetical protein